MSIQADAEVAANVQVGGTDRSGLFYDSVQHIWYTKNQAGTLAPLVNGVSSLTASDSTITLSGTTGALTISRPAITGPIAISAGSNVTTITSQTGTGTTFVMDTNAVLITPNLGTPSAIVLTNATGTAASLTAGTATNAVNSGITNDNATNATMFLTWTTASSGNLPLKVSSTKLTFNPSSSTLTATTFSGALSGNATSATTATTATNANNVATVATATNASFFPLFVASSSDSNQVVNLDSSGFTYNPSTNNLTATTFTGALAGNATTSTNTTGNAATVTTNANLTGPITSVGNATSIASQTGTGTKFVMDTAATINPKNIEGTVYIDPTNTQGWAGADAGAWINTAYAFLKTTYGSGGAGGPTFGGVIQLAPGLYTYTTPIVMETQYFTIILRGSGDGATTSNSNGGTMLSYTPTTGIALNIGGGSNNTGGVQVEDLNLQGAGLANSTTGIKWGLLGASSTAGATCKNVAIQGFGTGMAWENNTNIAYAVTCINVKIQFNATGIKPFGEANIFLGGLIGGNTTGVDGSNTGTDACFLGTAFDDNTTVAITCSTATTRFFLNGCRFENAGLGTDLYISQSNGSIIIQGGSMQSDLTTAGPSTGFGNLSGGNFVLRDTWLLAQGSRVFTQAFNVSGTVIARVTPLIPLNSVGITTIMQTGFTDRGVLNVLTANVAVPITTETLVMNARIPANAATVGQVYRIKAVAVTTGANAVTWRVRNGAAGTVADATVANVVAGAAGVANGRSTYEALFTVRTIGGAGTAQCEGYAVTAATVASTTAAAAATTAVVTNAAWFIDVTMANTIAAATVVECVIEAIGST